MEVEVTEGTVFKSTLRKYGPSFYAPIPLALLKYLELKEGDMIAMKCETGKYGPYVGIGKLQIDNAVEAEEKTEA